MKVSIVIPLYNEKSNILDLISEIQNSLFDIDFECVLVDDGSNDDSFDTIKKASLSNSNIKGISLSRNFGQQIALYAGINEANGDIIVTMDADLQHPPKEIPTLIKKYKEGYDIVNTKRVDLSNHSTIKKLTSKWYYRIINRLSDIKVESASSDFRLMSRKAADAFLNIREKDRFNRGLISWMGFKQAIIEFDAPPRTKGISKFTFKKMIKLGLDGIISFSVKPLRLIFNFGLINLFAGLIYLVYVFIQYNSGNTIPGWTSTMIVILILGGFQLISLGIIGQYIARIFNESKNRPMYFIKDKC